ncbi:VOC family protein [Protaetiibacter intestinalis]|uniref:VOC family protein n=1 Tax=Protaetiibacter intestinalis TaxID=2419774 RepID=A0A387BBT3_9MICO|nr:VOC family protein [Protaetiibacter intestinalis]AYF98606.1 VOC family protein [Protaetiibacter intestinalis]
MMSSGATPSFLALQTRDPEASARFYEQQLGMRRAPQAPPGAVVFPTASIPFAVRLPDEGLDPEAGPAGLGIALWLRAEGVEALHERLAADGVDIVRGPHDTPFGRAIVVRDPAGYRLTLHEG